MHESNSLEGYSYYYNPDFDRVGLSAYFGETSPYFNHAEDLLSGGLFEQSLSPAYLSLLPPQPRELIPAAISLGGQPKPASPDALFQQLTQQYGDSETDSPVHYITPVVSSPQPSAKNGSLLFQPPFAAPDNSSWRDSWPTLTARQPLAPNTGLVPQLFDSLDDEPRPHHRNLSQQKLPHPARILDAPRKLPISLPSISPFDSPSPEAHDLSPRPSPRRYKSTQMASCVPLPELAVPACLSFVSDPVQINFITLVPDPPVQAIVPTAFDGCELLDDKYLKLDGDRDLLPRRSDTIETVDSTSEVPSINTHEAGGSDSKHPSSPRFDLPVFNQEGCYENKGRETLSCGLAARGTKRHSGEGDGETEPGRASKRGKIVHQESASSLDDPPPVGDDPTNNTTRDVVVADSVHNTRPFVNIQSGQMSCEEMFRHLVDHGCVDLSLRVDPGEYSSGLIAGGAFGDVWKGKLIDGTKVAVKVWRFTSLLHNGSKSMKRAMREIYYWSKVKHEYVQELMGVVMFQGRLGMVSRWMDHGNLREYICKNPEIDRYPLRVQVTIGVAYLHSRDIVHGDLKGMNVLISRDGIAKLSDFDHSTMSCQSVASPFPTQASWAGALFGGWPPSLYSIATAEEMPTRIYTLSE